MKLTHNGTPVESVGMFFAMVLSNWALKLFVAWVVYSIATYFGAPMWVVIAVTAVGACETKIDFK